MFCDSHNFNKLNHHGFQRRGPYPLGNTKLVIQMIPPELNNISKLNEHFSKFGTIVNLQVAYKNDPEGALIQFSCPDQARRAYESTEAVLNNRFIKMQWYREDTSRHMHNKPWPSVQFTQHSAETTPQPSVKDRLGPMPTAHPEPASSSTSPNPSKITVREPLGLSELEGHGAKVPSTSSGLTKTVYNPAALKSIQKGAQFGTNVIADDVQKRKQLLVSKLEKSKSKKEKTLIMQAITSLTITITKLQEEIKGLPPPNAFRTTIKSKAQAQKELLDTELDLYKKTQSGEDIADLKIKCTQLQLEAAKMGLLTPCRGRGAHIRGRGALRSRGRGIRGRGRGLPTHAVVDHRPRALEISGFTENDVVDLLPHFAQYGEIEDCQMEDSSLSAIITFKTRAEAEQAAVHGVRLNKQELHLAWHKPTTSLNTTDPDEGEPEDEEFAEDSLVDDSLLQDDEEEEEDNESRSWRR
ncbi:hypothetical protein DNTS_027904 [Danionella cerebrum]|uniref:RRM domain-containing protein n=1 Tax=Danionella cerebrum TaxID=2873325 RepID=A0A553R817_9TELE|nr:hypothetical protein DNTS_027904 [Danionella translucida]